ncbi:RTA1 domain-containing protein [Magnaporthiopsis poae ATCC 64411]|uniref:RTA1 domain-containing protein n=1 Tax=Magnaporthiopsis poae (strain ATCC 64411 / 73-15) TaxID=644358 RepID=A0A0C4EC67_MAGP6|nr:RTA1 domain-containing protein [Magnaporthiopsis poae ATCC 64411]
MASSPRFSFPNLVVDNAGVSPCLRQCFLHNHLHRANQRGHVLSPLPNPLSAAAIQTPPALLHLPLPHPHIPKLLLPSPAMGLSSIPPAARPPIPISVPIDLAPAVSATVLFALFAALHAVSAIFTRKTYSWVLVAAAVLEAAAYALRSAAASAAGQHQYASSSSSSLPLLAGHALLARLSPLWISAFAHMTFAREVLFYAPGAAVARIPAGHVSNVLVGMDVVSFALQLSGGILSFATTKNNTKLIKTGVKVQLAGVSLHQAATVSLVVLMVLFAVRMARYDRDRGHGYGAGVAEPVKRSWRVLHYALAAVACLLTMRDVFRLVELGLSLTPRSSRRSSSIIIGIGSEKYGYAFDALPVLLALLVFAVVHPGRFLVGHDAEFPTLAERRRLERAMRELEEQKQAQFGTALGGGDWARERGWD